MRIRLNLDKHLRIKISDKSLTQRFNVSMTSLSSEKIKYRLVNIIIPDEVLKK